MCVCVRKRERERDSQRAEREMEIFKLTFLSSFFGSKVESSNILVPGNLSTRGIGREESESGSLSEGEG